MMIFSKSFTNDTLHIIVPHLAPFGSGFGSYHINYFTSFYRRCIP